MTTPLRDTRYLDGEITAALAALRGARAACSRSLNADTIKAERRCEERLDLLLDKRAEAGRIPADA